MAGKKQYSENRKTEKVVLILYCLYTIVIAAFIVAFGIDTWVAPTILMGMLVGIIVYLSEYKTYVFRAYFIAILCYFDFVICTLSANNFTTVFPFSIALMVVFAMYEIPKLINIGVICFTGLFGYHILINDIFDGTLQQTVQLISQMIAVYLSAFILHHMNKKHVAIHQKLYENIAALELAEKSKDDFMANVSHEIRTPVNTICGISEIMLQEHLEPEVRENIFDIQTAGMNLLSIISDILDFSEFQTGKSTVIEDSYNITSTINDIINMTNAKNDEKNLEIVVDCDLDMPSGLIGDEQKIRRAIMNIVDNAIKFTHEGGIILSIRTRQEAYGVNLCVTVQDTGVGIQEKDLEKLFDSYNQVDTKRNRQETGLGLGLAVAKTIVEKMGGFISVESTYGVGTTVSIVVPQRVERTESIIAVENADKFRVLTYLDFANYKYSVIRDSYEKSISRFMKQSGIAHRYCNSLSDVKHFKEHEKFTHLLVGVREYNEDKAYFDGLAEELEILLFCDYKNAPEENMLCIYKPFYALSIAAALQGDAYHSGERGQRSYNGFKAPEARVLVVDDNLMNLKVVEGLLAPYEIKVSVAESGQEALRKVEHRNYDFIFMDHMMPGMDGVETFHRIRQKAGAYYQNVPIIALTANAVAGAKEMFLTEGFSDYITKPLEPSALERVLKKFIPAEKQIKTVKSNHKKDAPKVEEMKLEKPQEWDELWGNIDSGLGLQYCGGSYKDYLEILRMYYDAGEEKMAAIQAAYEAKDWQNYEIHTHSLKSMSLNIGAVKLSEMAKKLEVAGKAADEAYITAHTKEALDEYASVLDIIGANGDVFPDAGKESSEKVDAEWKSLKAKLDEIEMQLDTFEADIITESLEALYTYSYKGKALKELLLPVSQKVNEFDFLAASEILLQIRKELE